MHRVKQSLSGGLAREIVIIGTKVLLALAILELIYVLIANVALGTTLVRRGVASAQGLSVEYESAYSVLPGRAKVRGLRLRFEDYNVEFLVSIEVARLDVSLHELAARKFHVRSLIADDVRFLMRHKVESVESNEARLSAFPKIPGFSDPPLYRGVRPPPTPERDFDKLWDIHLENVVARVRELWVLEYRFEGAAEARGGFLLRPARWLRVAPSRLTFSSGTLRLGEHTLAGQFSGTISCEVPGLDVRNASGLKPIQEIIANLDVTLTDGKLSGLDMYTEPRLRTNLEGSLSAGIRARVIRGKVEPPTRIHLSAPDLIARAGPIELSAGTELVLERPQESHPVRLRLEVNEATFAASYTRRTNPKLRKLIGQASLGQLDITRPAELSDIDLALDAIAGDLAWFDGFFAEPEAVHLGGSAVLRLSATRNANAQGKGEAVLQLDRGSFTRGMVRLVASGEASSRFRTEERPKRFVQGATSVRLSGASSLLTLVDIPVARDLVAKALDVDELTATIAFHAASSAVTLEITQARSGRLSATGFYSLPSKGTARGAMLLSMGALRLGLGIEDSRTQLTPLVSEDWLERERKRQFTRTSSR